MSLATHLILNHQTPTSLSFLSTSHKFFLSNNTLTLSPKSSTTLSLSSLSSSLQFSVHNQPHPQLDDSDEEEIVIGDCLVFEEGIFEDPNIQQELTTDSKKGKSPVEVEPENLIPEKWKEVQEAINISKKERRKIAQQMEFGRRLEKKKQGLRPLTDQYVAYRDAKLSQLKPLILDTPTFPLDKNDDEIDKADIKEERNSNRVAPRNPRLAVYGRTLEDVSHFLNSQNYDPQAVQNSDGPRKLFSKEEKVLMNRRVPDLAAATSGKWQPLHTLAASGEFYLLGDLLKHNFDINVPDKDGLTALHKAILGKKQAIFNYLLRESANPFVRDKEGATLMHYAVRTASSQMIKILLLYNVDINLQDNDGWTPLHLAVQSRRTDIVRLLLIKGADKTLKNRDGLTPLDLCLYSGRDMRTYELIKLMKQLPKA